MGQIFGDIGKAAINVGEYIAKSIDNLPEMCNLFEFTNRYCPELATEIGKTDAFAVAVENISKTDRIKLTKEKAETVTQFVKAAGKTDELVTVRKVSGITEVEVPKEAWNLPPAKRGKAIDNYINKHDTMGLGENFPVADRVEDMTLISTKSMDLGLQSYQNPTKLRNVLNRYADKLKAFEKDYFNGKNSFTWAKRTLKRSEYNKKALEIVFLDVMLTDDVVNELNSFKKAMEKEGIEVIYLIGVPLK